MRATIFCLGQNQDIEDVLRLIEQYYSEDGYPFDRNAMRKAVEKLIETPTLGRIWLIYQREQIVGYMVLTLGFSLEYQGRDAFLDEIYIVQNFRGQGIGKEALRFMEAQCRELGVRAWHLEVERDKPGAQRLYRQAGFADNNRLLLTKRLKDG